MRTSNHSSAVGVKTVINGTYVKIKQFDNILYVTWGRIQSGAVAAGTSLNILTITNWDNSTSILQLPTSFQVLSTGITFESFVLPLNVKTIVLTTNATDPGDVGA